MARAASDGDNSPPERRAGTRPCRPRSRRQYYQRFEPSFCSVYTLTRPLLTRPLLTRPLLTRPLGPIPSSTRARCSIRVPQNQPQVPPPRGGRGLSPSAGLSRAPRRRDFLGPVGGELYRARPPQQR